MTVESPEELSAQAELKRKAKIRRQEITDRQRAYAHVFNSENEFVKIVMRDLENFCRADRTCFHPDPRMHAAAEGRREVYLRIQDHKTLTIDEFIAKNRGEKV